MVGRVQLAERFMLRRHRPDTILILLVGLLLIFSLIIIYSISPAVLEQEDIALQRQFVYIVLGIAAFAGTAVMPLGWWRRLQGPLIIASIVTSLLLLVPGVGTTVKGATRWLSVGDFSFQPVELVKFTVLIYAAVFLAERMRLKLLNSWSQTIMPVTVLLGLLSLVVVLLQRNMSTMIVIFAMVMTMLYVAGVRLRLLGLMAGIFGGVGLVAITMFPHRLSRVLTFFQPGADLEGSGYHINQALIAIGSGGLLGKGLGKSVQVFGYLPEAAHDSIFAIVAEKIGFVGALMVLTVYGALFFRILRIIERVPNNFMRLVASGVLAWLAAHTIINIGAMLGLLPLTGITLPLLSFGGSSLVFTMAALGLVFQISRYTDLSLGLRKEHADARFGYGRRNRRPRYAHFGRSGGN